jgi:hypothetical protein
MSILNFIKVFFHNSSSVRINDLYIHNRSLSELFIDKFFDTRLIFSSQKICK